MKNEPSVKTESPCDGDAITTAAALLALAVEQAKQAIVVARNEPSPASIALAASELRCETLEVQIQDLERTVRSQLGDIDTARALSAQREAELVDRHSRLATLQETSDAALALSAQREAELVNKDREIAVLQANLDLASARSAKCENALNSMGVTVAEAHQTHTILRTQITALESMAAVVSGLQEQDREELAAIRAEVAMERETFRKERAALEAQVLAERREAAAEREKDRAELTSSRAELVKEREAFREERVALEAQTLTKRRATLEELKRTVGRMQVEVTRQEKLLPPVSHSIPASSQPGAVFPFKKLLPIVSPVCAPSVAVSHQSISNPVTDGNDPQQAAKPVVSSALVVSSTTSDNSVPTPSGAPSKILLPTASTTPRQVTFPFRVTRTLAECASSRAAVPDLVLTPALPKPMQASRATPTPAAPMRPSPQPCRAVPKAIRATPRAPPQVLFPTTSNTPGPPPRKRRRRAVRLSPPIICIALIALTSLTIGSRELGISPTMTFVVPRRGTGLNRQPFGTLLSTVTTTTISHSGSVLDGYFHVLRSSVHFLAYRDLLVCFLLVYLRLPRGK
ncbi:hypothetical protein DFH06DRAFT_576120 [Mycena polygramma]|nr:hypothetical protein DFH06DRAFT_576120 [Mycena polygramma]